MIRISNFLSYIFIYILPYAFLVLVAAGFVYNRFYEEDVVAQFVYGFMFLVGLLNWWVYSGRFAFVYYHSANHSIVARKGYNETGVEYSLEDLWKVRKFLIWGSLKFRDGRLIRYLPKYPSLFEADGENYVVSLKKRAKANRERHRLETTEN